MIASYSKYRKYKEHRKPYKVKKKKSFVFNKVFWIFGVSILSLSGIFYFFVFSSFFQVEAVEISGLQKISQEGLKKIVEQNTQKRILLFSSKNIFLTDFGKIKKEALGSYPQLDILKIKRRLPQTLLITAEEKKPAAIFVSGETKFFIDKKGVIFEEITDVQPGLPKIITNGLNENLKLGQEIINKDRLSKIIVIDYRLNADFGTNVDVFEIAAPDKLVVKTREGWEFYLNIEGDVDWQLTKLGVVLEEKIPPERRRDLEYIELRFGNFAPYKYK